MKVEVQLFKNRSTTGILRVFADDGQLELGPVPCLGKADNQDAADKGNPTRDPLRSFGDTPTGGYAIAGLKTHENDEHDRHTYGSYPSVRLAPTEGDALQAKKNGRSGLLIHGGAPSRTGNLRPTNGCIRLSDDHQRDLVTLVVQATLAASSVNVTEV